MATIGFLIFMVFVIAFIVYKEKEDEQNATKENVLDVLPHPTNEKPIRDVNDIKCPYCGCSKYTIMKRGWKFTTGMIGSSKPIRVCDNCLRKY